MRTLSEYGNVMPCHSGIFKLLKISKLISWSHGRVVNNPDMIRTFFTQRCLVFPMNGSYVRHRGRSPSPASKCECSSLPEPGEGERSRWRVRPNFITEALTFSGSLF